MDIPRKSAARKRRIRRILYALTALVAVGLISVGVSRLRPAAPTVEKGTIWPDTVKRGSMLRNVRGLGTLVPEEIRWVPAITQGRVERRLILAGAHVHADTIIMELSNPDVQQTAVESQSQLRGAEADLASLKVQLEKDLLDQKASTATIGADYKSKEMTAEVNDELGKKQLKSRLEVELSRIQAADAKNRFEIAQKQLEISAARNKTQLAAQEEKIEQLRTMAKLREGQVEALKVRAGIEGDLQVLLVEVGQQVTAGTSLAKVADPRRLKAELKIAETQAKDIMPGQTVSVDTRNGLIEGTVSRVDPAVQNGTVTVDVHLVSEMPKGARPDLSVDGTIQLEKLDNVLYVGRPVHGQENSTIGLFKFDETDQYANRVQVRLGKSSVNTIEILDGLKEGDKVILSDTSQYDNNDRIRVN